MPTTTKLLLLLLLLLLGMVQQLAVLDKARNDHWNVAAATMLYSIVKIRSDFRNIGLETKHAPLFNDG